MIDSRERFSAAVDSYQRYRPGYPPALFDWITLECGLAPGARVADLGCGTGIATRLLAARGFDVIGVEPNPDMLAAARAAGGPRYQSGEAAATGLPEGSLDLVTAAQAYHWFDVAATIAESRRILKPGGWCVAFWNLRGEGAFNEEYDTLLRTHASEYRLEKPRATLQAIRERPEVRDIREAVFPNAQSLDHQGLRGRAYSSSYVLHGLRDKAGFDSGLDALFVRHARSGLIELRYSCVAMAFRIPVRASGPPDSLDPRAASAS